MRKILVSLWILAATLAILRAQPRSAAALEGLDPVLLIEGTETPGKEGITLRHGRFLYQFAGEETRRRFEKEPARYAIQQDGACARMGPPAGGNPDAYYVYKGRLYIFGTQECYKRFVADPAKYLEEAPPPGPAPPAAARDKARVLIEKAVEAAGGAARLESLRGYTETRANMERTVRFPGSIRVDRRFDSRSMTQVATRDTGFTVFQGNGQRLPPSFAAYVSRQVNREALAALRARGSAGFRAVYSGAEGSIERVAVELNGESWTLGIDSSSGRLVRLGYRDRGPEGDFGAVALTFSDFREVNGLWLPFRAEATFNGAAEPRLSWTTQSFALNPANLEALFEPPQKLEDF